MANIRLGTDVDKIRFLMARGQVMGKRPREREA